MELTPEQRERLAVEVLGWSLNQEFNFYSWGVKNVIQAVCDKSDWQPDQSIEQAFMVAEKIGMLDLSDVGVKRWKAAVGSMDGYCRAETPALAICLAALAWLDRK